MFEDAVTVVMPVRNAEHQIQRALFSVLNQTHKRFEILVIDDGSDDHSAEVALDVGGSRVHVIRQEKSGVAAALNLAVKESSTELIARLDADDVAATTRLENQVAFMTSHRNCVALGTGARVVNTEGNFLGVWRMPLNPEANRLRLCLKTSLIHPSVMFRRSSVLAAGNYWSPSERPFPEDYHLWSRLISYGEIHNLSTPLITYTSSNTGTVRAAWPVMARASAEIAAANMSRELGIELDAADTAGLLLNYYQRNRRLSPREALKLQVLVARLIASDFGATARGAFSGSEIFAPTAWALKKARIVIP